MINNALFSSTTDMWETPKDLFDKLDEEFEFQTDVCAIKQMQSASASTPRSKTGLNRSGQECAGAIHLMAGELRSG